jgi:hypothetical protein
LTYTEYFKFIDYCLNYSHRYNPSKASDEVLQAGDMIFYYDAVFGTRHSGEKTVTVIEVIPDNNLMIRLDNMGIIAHSHSIKCVKIVTNGTIIDNPNPKWRHLEEFFLIPGKIRKLRNIRSQYWVSMLETS